jgi:CheY-like chemotaxis protein
MALGAPGETGEEAWDRFSSLNRQNEKTGFLILLTLMNQKAFIIDDDQICHFITRNLIKSEKLAQEVTCFFEAEEALELLAADVTNNMPDIIFLDLNMPHMDGWQFLEALRPYEAQIRSRSKIFILTSSVDAVDQEKARNYSYVSGYFYKPLQSADLKFIGSLLKDDSQ